MKEVDLYTDGSCRPNPGNGGWAFILQFRGSEKVGSGSSGGESTNNRMELKAVLEGLKALKYPCKVYLYTDSEYVKNGIQRWMWKWAKEGWTKMNVDLWKEIYELSNKHEVFPKIVKGHSGHPQNERCDLLAKSATWA